MKCPYRVSVSKRISKDTTTKATTVREQTNYEECYEDECPFYCSGGAYREPICYRVENEKGDLL